MGRAKSPQGDRHQGEFAARRASAQRRSQPREQRLRVSVDELTARAAHLLGERRRAALQSRARSVRRLQQREAGDGAR